MEKQFKKMMSDAQAKETEKAYGYTLEEAEEKPVIIKRPHAEARCDDGHCDVTWKPVAETIVWEPVLKGYNEEEDEAAAAAEKLDASQVLAMQELEDQEYDDTI